MRTIKELPIPQDADFAKFPDGQIINETEIVIGTPVVREIYGDIIANIYKIIKDAGLVFTETEDSESTQYQLLDALKVFVNNTNDKQQILTISGANINTVLDFDNLPNSFVFVGKITDALSSLVSYNLNSAGAAAYPVVSVGNMPANSTVLVILDAGGTKIISLEALLIAASPDVSFGTPLSFNSSDNVLFLSGGTVFAAYPKSNDVLALIRTAELNNDIELVDAILFKGKLICFTLDTNALVYQAFAFDALDLSILEGEITMPATAGVDNAPYIYCDGAHVYFSNSSNSVNNSANDYDFGKFAFNENTLVFSFVSAAALNVGFQKTTNAFLNSADNHIYTFIAGVLVKYNLTSGAGANLLTISGVNGQVFKFNGFNYYSNGETSIKWNY